MTLFKTAHPYQRALLSTAPGREQKNGCNPTLLRKESGLAAPCSTQGALFRRESIAMASMGADEPPPPPVRPRVLPLSSADHQLIKKIHTYKGGEEPPVKSPRRSDRIAARRSGAPLVRGPSISTPVCRVGASARPYITREPPTMTPQNYTTKSRRLKIRTLRKKRRLKTLHHS